MTHSGWQPPPGPPPSAFAPPPSDARGTRWLALALVAALAVLGAVGYLVVRHTSSKDSASGPAYPKRWDARMLPLVHFVEHARGMPFKHAIKVEFLADARFRARLLSDPDQNAAAAGRQARDAAALFRAVGLLAGNVDLGKQVDQLTGSSVIGFYSFDTKSLAVRGRTLTLAVKDTVVHELTHALQDQYFDIGAAAKRIDKDPRASDDALRAVVEGDAVRIEDKYAKSLPAGQRRRLQREQASEGKAADRATRKVPQILQVMAEGPYVLGPKVLDFAAQAKGSGGPNYLLEHLPDSDMQVLQPWRYLTRSLAHRIPEPALRSGERRLPGTSSNHGTFGAEAWYYMLAEQLGATRALRAVDGWAGDGYVAFRRGAQTCFRVSYEATSNAALHTMDHTVRSWISSMPAANRATETLQNSRMLFAACDPGAKRAKPVKGRSIAALRLLVERVELATAFLREGASTIQAGCAVERIAARLPQHDLEAQKISAHARAVITSSITACR